MAAARKTRSKSKSSERFNPFMVGMIDVMAKASAVRQYERMRIDQRVNRERSKYYEWKITAEDAEKIARDHAKEVKKKEAVTKKTSEIECPACRHVGVVKNGVKSSTDKYGIQSNKQLYRCKKCEHIFALKEDKPAKVDKPKETPQQKEVRLLKEKLQAEQEKFKKHAKLQATLVKENKALKAEVEMLKKTGIFLKGIPGQPKPIPEKDRFANLDL